MTYLPEISWLCKVIRSKLLENFRYKVTVRSINPNDPGKNTVTIGDWLVDYKGNIFQVETLAMKDGDGTISFTVYDINEQSLGSSGRVAPLMGFNAYVYRASQGGFLLSQARKGILSKAAEDRIEQMENDVIWRYRGLEVEGWYPDYDDESDSDDDIHTETNITKLTLSSDFAMDEEEDGWQGGKGFRLSLATDNFLSYWHNIASAARLFGGEITSNGDGTVHIDAGAGIVKLDEATPQDIPTAINQGQGSQVVYAEWDEVASLELSDNAYNYIYYCADDDEVKTTTDFYSISFTRDFTIGRAYRYGTTVVVRLCGTNAWNFNRRVQLFGEEYFDVVRAKGMIIGETGTRNISVTEGVLWAELVNRFPTDAFDSSGTDRFTYWYKSAVDTWTSVATQSQISNTQYNDLSTYTLKDLLPNRYGVHWIYMVHDSSVHVVYGNGNYTLAQAELAMPPSSLPGLLSSYATLIGKCIIEKDDTVFTELLTPFTDTFTPSVVTYHDDLSGLVKIDVPDTTSYVHLDEYSATALFYDTANPPTTIPTNDIRRDSNIGIGKDPAYKLDVNGTGHFVEALTLDVPLTVANGGTGKSTLTANKVLVGNEIDGILSPAALTWDNVNNYLGVSAIPPQAKIHSYSTASNQLYLQQGSKGVGDFSEILFGISTATYYHAAIRTERRTAIAGDLVFLTQNTSVNYADLSERMRITHDGKMGIREASPEKQLHITGGGSSPTIRLEEDANTHYWDIINTSDDGYFQLSRNNSVKLQLDDNGKLCLGTTTSRQIITLGTTTSTSTSTPISIDMGGTYSNTAGTNLKLKLYNDGTNEGGFGISIGQIDYRVWDSYSSHVFYQGTTELMRIKGDGTIGINDPTPSYKLDVNGTGRFTGTLTTNDNISIVRADTNDAYISFISNSGSGEQWAIGIDEGNDGELTFSNNGVLNSPKMILSSVGLGIGTTATLYALDVNGTGRFTGALTLDSTLGFSTAGVTNIDRILDEDTMVSDSATALATQQSIKAYVDNAVVGYNWIVKTVVAATTGDITISTALNNGGTIDGVTLVTGDYVLVKDQTTLSQNGLYVVGASPARAPEMDAAGEFKNTTMLVSGGTNNAGSSWVCTSTVTTVDTDPVTFAKISQSSSYTAGNGIDITGNTISIDSPLSTSYGGTGLTGFTASGRLLYSTSSSVLTTLAAESTGNVLLSGSAPSWGKVGLTTHVSGALPVANGGTGQSSYKAGDILYAPVNGSVLGIRNIGTTGQVLVASGTPQWKYPYEIYSGFKALTSDSSDHWDCENDGLNVTWEIDGDYTLTIDNEQVGMCGVMYLNVTAEATVTLSGVTEYGNGTLTDLPVGRYMFCFMCIAANTINWNIALYE